MQDWLVLFDRHAPTKGGMVAVRHAASIDQAVRTAQRARPGWTVCYAEQLSATNRRLSAGWWCDWLASSHRAR